MLIFDKIIDCKTLIGICRTKGGNHVKKRGAGVLFHISSIPGDYGVGVFDENALHFIDKISEMGFSYWQVLPFNPLDGANSPYCSPSALPAITFYKPKRAC